MVAGTSWSVVSEGINISDSDSWKLGGALDVEGIELKNGGGGMSRSSKGGGAPL